jgi:pyrimidine-nucleoside phosphorylase
MQVVRDVGFAIGGQSTDMCPADGILYALRDATATVNETGLIAASVMSKKIAGGAKHILIDVKVGRGAFMPDEASARKLTERMVYVGQALGRNVRCILTDMDQPLGRSVGNALEVNEAVECLRGNGPADVMEVCREAAVELAVMSGLYDADLAAGKFDKAIEQGTALGRFIRFVDAQGGETGWIASGKGLPVAENIIEVKYEGGKASVVGLDALAVGEITRRMGGGRLSKEDKINPAVGVILHKKIGDIVTDGELLAEIFCRESGNGAQWAKMVLDAYTFTNRDR